MNAILIAWIVSMLFCGLYTLFLPAWDASVQKRQKKVREATSTSSRRVTSHAA